MDINWLKDFAALSRERNFRIAADQRGISQPAFSRRIQALELWVNAPLIDRNCQPSRLTEAGLLFLPVAQKIVDLAEAGKSAVQDQIREKGRNFRFATLGTLSQIFIPAWLKSLHPFIDADQFSVSTEFATLGSFMGALEDNAVDFFISYVNPDTGLPGDTSDFDSLILGEEKLIAVARPHENGSPRWWLPDRPKGPIPCLHTFSDHSPWPIKNHMEEKYGDLTFESVYDTSNSTALKEMAIEGFGLAWLPRTLVCDDLDAGRLVRVAGPADDLCVDITIYRSQKNTAPHIEKFWQVLTERVF